MHANATPLWLWSRQPRALLFLTCARGVDVVVGLPERDPILANRQLGVGSLGDPPGLERILDVSGQVLAVAGEMDALTALGRRAGGCAAAQDRQE